MVGTRPHDLLPEGYDRWKISPQYLTFVILFYMVNEDRNDGLCIGLMTHLKRLVAGLRRPSRTAYISHCYRRVGTTADHGVDRDCGAVADVGGLQSLSGHAVHGTSAAVAGAK